MKKTFTAFVEYDDENKLYVGIIPNVPGAHTQAETLDELQHNLPEVLELCLEENPEIAVDSSFFFIQFTPNNLENGLQTIQHIIVPEP